MYPSEYAYHKDSVTRAESVGVNCRMYAAGITHQRTEDYIHCDGSQLKLTDSNTSESNAQYRSGDYYVWPTSTSSSQILFIFPTRVNLTTITLHYYRDSDQRRPGLRFFTVLNTFDIWDAPTVSDIYVEVPAEPEDGEPDGHRKISISFNFDTARILMIKFRSEHSFAVSEVKFFTCTGK